MILQKNLKALDKSPLLKALSSIDIKDYALVKGESGLNIRLKTSFLYENPNEELLNSLSFFTTKCKFYPVLFFYGLGSAALYKLLLENEKLEKLIIFEKELELIKLCLSFFDFSKDLAKKRLIILDPLDKAELSRLFDIELLSLAHKIYKLNIHSIFYEKNYKDEISYINSKLLFMMKTRAFSYGNDYKDSLLGIKNTLTNLKDLLENPPIRAFLKENKFKFKNAVIVSTGPSLQKQLKLLKENQDKIIIFCPDSSYSILYENEIVPDFVFSLERIPLSSEFFNNDYKDFDKDTIFIISALTHPNTIKYLKKKQRKFILALRPLHFSSSLKLDDFGYLAQGLSVSNMAFEMAAALRFENIILIGQDLAYSEDKSSHSKGYIYKNMHEKDYERDYKLYECEAYAGLGVVQSSLVWTLFRGIFEKDIALVSSKLDIKVYNATQGGARIQNAIEKPFKQCCEELLKESLAKNFVIVKNEEAKIKALKKAVKKRLKKLLLEQEKFLKLYEATKKEDLKNLELLMLKLRESEFFSELFLPLYFQKASELIKMKALDFDEKERKKLLESFFKEALALLSLQDELLRTFLKDKI